MSDHQDSLTVTTYCDRRMDELKTELRWLRVVRRVIPDADVVHAKQIVRKMVRQEVER